MEIQPRWLKPNQVRIYCGWSKNTLMKRIREGNIVASKDRGVWKIYAPSIDKYLSPNEDPRRKKILEIAREILV